MQTGITNDPLRPDNHTLAISIDIIPDLIRLHQTAPKLFNEFILAALAHEGGKVGHLMRWPISSVDEALKYFNWKQFNAQAASSLIQNFVRRIWPIELERSGTPSIDSWLPALTIIKETLSRFGYDPLNPEPFGITWKEFQAMYGMVQDRGIRSVAIFIWFERDFRKINVDLQSEFANQFNFLNEREQKEVILLMAKIQREYVR